MPNHICVDCWMTLKKCHEFCNKVVDAQNKYLQTVVKVEQVVQSTNNTMECVSMGDSMVHNNERRF